MCPISRGQRRPPRRIGREDHLDASARGGYREKRKAAFTGNGRRGRAWGKTKERESARSGVGKTMGAKLVRHFQHSCRKEKGPGFLMSNPIKGGRGNREGCGQPVPARDRESLAKRSHKAKEKGRLTRDKKLKGKQQSIPRPELLKVGGEKESSSAVHRIEK